MIEFACTQCGKHLKVKAEAAGKKGKCPQCGTLLHVPDAAPEPILETAPDYPRSSPKPKRSGLSASNAGHKPEPAGLREDVRHVADGPGNNQFAQPINIAASAGGIGLLILALSPLFRWISFGAGGVMGISGDGKIVMGVTVVSIILFALAVFARKGLAAVSLGVGAWGTVVMFWMGGLIWKVGSIFDSPDVKSNPFAAILATQVSPGAGLYLGLIGGLIAAAAFGYLAVRRPRQRARLWPFYVAQGGAIALGVLVAVAVGFERPSNHEGMLPPALGRARDEARKVRCAANLSQIGKGAAIWINTKGKNKFYPPSLKSLVDDKMIDEPRVFLCPAGDTQLEAGKFISDYACVLDMIGRKTTEVECPSDLPLAWDKVKIHEDGRNVVFFDAHVEFIVEEDFQALMKRLEVYVQDLKAGKKPQWGEDKKMEKYF
jgi:prepilin-type processing-associated H-X9-DG protein